MEKMSIMQSEFKPLDLEFRGKGQQKCFWFKCLNRVGDVALYEKRDTEDGGVWWEVIVVQKRVGGTYMMGGCPVTFESKERYPSDEQFGVEGWCYSKLEEAEKKFASMLAA